MKQLSLLIQLASVKIFKEALGCLLEFRKWSVPVLLCEQLQSQQPQSKFLNSLDVQEVMGVGPTKTVLEKVWGTIEEKHQVDRSPDLLAFGLEGQGLQPHVTKSSLHDSGHILSCEAGEKLTLYILRRDGREDESRCFNLI